MRHAKNDYRPRSVFSCPERRLHVRIPHRKLSKCDGQTDRQTDRRTEPRVWSLTTPTHPARPGYRQNPAATNPLVRLGLNPVKSKSPSFYCECRNRDRQINSSRCILCTSRRTKVMMYIHILQLNENTKHRFRRLYSYIFIPRLLMTNEAYCTNICIYVSFRNVKCHLKFNLVEGGGFVVHPPDQLSMVHISIALLSTRIQLQATTKLTRAQLNRTRKDEWGEADVLNSQRTV